MGRRPSHGRQEIIGAAYRVLGEKGLDSASIKEIAQAAGVAPGLVHYYFKDKEELLLAVLHEASDRYSRAMADSSSEQLEADALAEPRSRVEQEPEWYRLRYELFAMGLRNPAIRPGVAALLANGRQGISHLVSKLAPAAHPHQVAALLLACFDGLALQKLIDPEFDMAGAYAALEGLTAPLRTAR